MKTMWIRHESSVYTLTDEIGGSVSVLCLLHGAPEAIVILFEICMCPQSSYIWTKPGKCSGEPSYPSLARSQEFWNDPWAECFAAQYHLRGKEAWLPQSHMNFFCVYVCTCMHMCTCICRCACVEARSWHCVTSFITPHLVIVLGGKGVYFALWFVLWWRRYNSRSLYIFYI